MLNGNFLLAVYYSNLTVIHKPIRYTPIKFMKNEVKPKQLNEDNWKYGKGIWSEYKNAFGEGHDNKDSDGYGYRYGFGYG